MGCVLLLREVRLTIATPFPRPLQPPRVHELYLIQDVDMAIPRVVLPVHPEAFRLY